MKKNQRLNRLWILSAALLLALSMLLVGCDLLEENFGITFPEMTTSEPTAPDTSEPVGSPTEESAPETNEPSAPVILHQLNIEGNHLLYMEIGDTLTLTTDAPEAIHGKLKWTASNGFVAVTQRGQITAQALGQTTITVAYSVFSDSVTVIVVDQIPTETQPVVPPVGTNPEDPPVDIPTEPVDPPTQTPTVPEKVDPSEIWEAVHSPSGYRPAESYEDALNRSQNGELSGYPYVPDQAPIISEYRPMQDGKYIKNNNPYYIDDNTYVVVDAYGREVFRIYRGGAYITLEEVAAYVWAFGDIPANHDSSKKTNPSNSIWGEYLRVNHTRFSGNTSKYPYEPELPRISGCGGDFTYYEMDIGTTGTDCDPGYYATIYNNGSKITRGAARIVYARFDRNGNKIIDPDEKYVFYTYNHYNDFQEYLNYYGGWGEMFGNITGGGTISSKYDYNPTDYVPTVNAPLPRYQGNILAIRFVVPEAAPVKVEATILHCDFHRYRGLAA